MNAHTPLYRDDDGQWHLTGYVPRQSQNDTP